MGDGPARYQLVTAAYVKAVRRAGGLPVVLPLLDPDDASDLLRRVDGVVVTSGADLDPSWWGGGPGEARGTPDRARDAFDLELARGAVAHDVPTLAVCRGCQVLNVALGGGVVGHVEGHDEAARYNEVVHPVAVSAGSHLAGVLDGQTDGLGVNSLHHQAVGALAPPARPAAEAPDGTVEAIEVDGAPHVLGVQWHPELRHRPEHLALFERLVRDAAET